MTVEIFVFADCEDFHELVLVETIRSKWKARMKLIRKYFVLFSIIFPIFLFFAIFLVQRFSHTRYIECLEYVLASSAKLVLSILILGGNNFEQ